VFERPRAEGGEKGQREGKRERGDGIERLQIRNKRRGWRDYGTERR